MEALYVPSLQALVAIGSLIIYMKDDVKKLGKVLKFLPSGETGTTYDPTAVKCEVELVLCLDNDRRQNIIEKTSNNYGATFIIPASAIVEFGLVVGESNVAEQRVAVDHTKNVFVSRDHSLLPKPSHPQFDMIVDILNLQTVFNKALNSPRQAQSKFATYKTEIHINNVTC